MNTSATPLQQLVLCRELFQASIGAADASGHTVIGASWLALVVDAIDALPEALHQARLQVVPPLKTHMDGPESFTMGGRAAWSVGYDAARDAVRDMAHAIRDSSLLDKEQIQ